MNTIELQQGLSFIFPSSDKIAHLSASFSFFSSVFTHLSWTRKSFFLEWNDKQILLLVIIITLLLYFFSPTRQSLFERELRCCWTDLKELVSRTNCHPILLRLAWSDAVDYDHSVGIDQWPMCGGSNGAIRFETSLSLPHNAGLNKAITILTNIKARYKRISWADLIQMAGAVAVECSGGPKITLRYGREDAVIDPAELVDNEELKQYYPTPKTVLFRVSKDEYCTRPLPRVFPPYHRGELTPDMHLRGVFYRLGLNNKDIVALCGAHTIGRAFQDRSGVCPFKSGDQGATKYTRLTSMAKGDRVMGAGMAGGCSWTKNWLVFDNSYFTRRVECDSDPDLLWLPTDEALFSCPEFKHFFLLYAEDQQAFFADYAVAHKKMSELGARFKRVSVPLFD